jgi:hypothetical protein
MSKSLEQLQDKLEERDCEIKSLKIELESTKDLLKKQSSRLLVASTSTPIKQKQVTLTEEAIIPETQAQEEYVLPQIHESSSIPTNFSETNQAFEQMLESQETQVL